MAETAVAERKRVAILDPVVRWVYGCPVWQLGAAVLAISTLIHGYEQSGAIRGSLIVARAPFHEHLTDEAWMYSSPLGPLMAWTLGIETSNGLALFSYLLTIGLVIGCIYAVRHWESDFAARLFALAYFCSPNAWAGTASLGLFDLLTVAGLTVAAVAPTGVCLAVGVGLGFNHFEQAGFALVAIGVIRIVIRPSGWRPVLAAFVGLVVGKLLLYVYLLSSGINPNARADFIRDRGLARIVGGWSGHIPLLEFAVYNVLWVGMIWMVWTMRPALRWWVIGLHLFLTIPVLITYDLSRVYRTVTWPLVILLVLYASDYPKRRTVQLGALCLVVAACVVPRTEIWHGGLIIN